MMKQHAGRTDPGFRDRSGRLILFGSLSLFVGTACAAVALLTLLLPFLQRLLPETGAPVTEARSAALGFLTYALASAVLVWAGIGSVRRRRWVRPVMLTVAWTWLFLGAFGLLGALILLDELPYLFPRGPEPWPTAIPLAVRAAVLGTVAFAGLILPALFLWAYRDEQVRRTLERHDPEPSWTDRCPWPVLLLSLELGLAALLTLFTALRPVVPLFGQLVTGWKGLLLLLAVAAAAGHLALGTYRRSMRAWWATTLLLIVVGCSVAVTAWVTDPTLLYRELGWHVPGAPGHETPAALVRAAGTWGSLGLTLLSVVYMAAVRRHFVAAPDERRDRAQT